MRTVLWRICLIFWFALIAETCWPQQASNGVVTVTTYWSASAVRPNEKINLAVAIDIKPRYHIVANTAREPFAALNVTISNIPEDMRTTTALYPKAEPLEVAGEKTEVFSGRVICYMSLIPT